MPGTLVVLLKPGGRPDPQGTQTLAWRAGGEAAAARAVEAGVPQRADPDHALLQDAVFPLPGQQSPHMADADVETVGCPNTAALRTRPSAPVGPRRRALHGLHGLPAPAVPRASLPRRRHGTSLLPIPGSIPAGGHLDFDRQDLAEPPPDAGPVPVAQPAPTGHAGAETGARGRYFYCKEGHRYSLTRVGPSRHQRTPIRKARTAGRLPDDLTVEPAHLLGCAVTGVEQTAHTPRCRRRER